MVSEADRQRIYEGLARRRSAMIRIYVLSPILVIGMALAFGLVIGMIWLVFTAWAVWLAAAHYRRVVAAATAALNYPDDENT